MVSYFDYEQIYTINFNRIDSKFEGNIFDCRWENKPEHITYYSGLDRH
jgi:hypothetical protein